MEIRTLRYFLAVAREENMTRAAEQLHVTQPTLSKALKALEDELDKKLFTRHSFLMDLQSSCSGIPSISANCIHHNPIMPTGQ